MSFSTRRSWSSSANLLNSLFRLKDHQSKGKRYRVYPGLEALEDRTVPATLEQHLAQISAHVTEAKADQYAAEITSSSEFDKLAIPVINASLVADVVRERIRHSFTEAFAEIRAAIAKDPDPNKERDEIIALEKNGFHTEISGAEFDIRYETDLTKDFLVAATQGVSRFGLDKYVKELKLSDLSSKDLTLNAHVIIDFGSVDDGSGATFFVGNSPILRGAQITKTISFGDGSTVKLVGSDLTVDLVNPGMPFHLGLDVGLGPIDATHGIGDVKYTDTNGQLDHLGDQVKQHVSGFIDLQATFRAKFVGIPFLEWTPTISWTLHDTGYDEANVDTTNADPQEMNQTELSSAVIGLNGKDGILSDNLLGTDSLSFGNLDFTTTVKVAKELQPILGALSTIYGQGFAPDSFKKALLGADGLKDQAANPKPQTKTNFQFDKSGILNYIAGKSGPGGTTDQTLFTYEISGPGPKFHPSLNFPIYQWSIFDIYWITISAGGAFDLTTNFSLKVGLDANKGLFLDQGKTSVSAQIGADAALNVTGSLFDPDIAKLQTDYGSAGIAGNITETLKLDNPDPTPLTPGLVYFRELGKDLDLSGSNPFAGLGAYLKNHFHFERTTDSGIVFNYVHKTPEGFFSDIFIPTNIRGPLGTFIHNSPVLSTLINEPDKLVGDLAAGAAQGIQSLFGGGKKKETGEVARALATGDVVHILDEIATKLWPKDRGPIPVHEKEGQDPPSENNPDPPPAKRSDILELLRQKADFEGIYHRLNPVTGTLKPDLASYTYIWDLDPTHGRVNASDLPSSNTSAPGSSAPADHLAYTISPDGKTLSVFPNPMFPQVVQHSAYTVSLQDLHNGSFQLVREAVLDDGSRVTDPTVTIPIVDGFQAFIQTGGGADSISVDNSLTFKVTVNSGDGNDYIRAGGGITTITAGKGDDSVILGAGVASVTLGNGNSTVRGGTGNLTVTVGNGNNTLFAGDGANVTITGGGGNNTFYGGAGADILDGRKDQSDTFVGGSGDSTVMYGGSGTNNFTAGTGTETMHGGSGNNTFFWTAGDSDGDGDANADGDHDGDAAIGGNLTILGGGTSLLWVEGAKSGNDFEMTTDNGHASISITRPATRKVDTVGVQTVDFDAGGGPSTLQVGDLTGTTVKAVAIGFPDHTVANQVTVIGSPAADRVLAKLTDNFIDVGGLAADVQALGTLPSDLLTVNGNGGDDVLKVDASALTAASVTLVGGAGKNMLEAGDFGGGPTNPAGSVTLVGGSQSDTFVVNNPAGSVFAPVPGVTVKGNGSAGEQLWVVNGGGPAFTESDRPGADARSGALTTTNGSLAQTISFTGLGQIADDVPAKSVTVTVPAARNNISILDGAFPDGFPVPVPAAGTVVTGPTFVPILVANKQTLDLDGSPGQNTFLVDNPNPGIGLATLSVRAGGGGDTFNVRATAGTVNTDLLGGKGNDRFNVSSDADATAHSGSLDGIKGRLDIDAGSGSANRLIVSNQGGAGSPGVIVTDGRITNFGKAAPITYQTDGAFTDGTLNDGILLLGSAKSPDTFNVQSTLTGSATEIDGDATNDVFNVSSDAPANRGDLAGIAGVLTVNSTAGADTLNVSEAGRTDGDTVFLTGSQIRSPVVRFTINYLASGAGSYKGGVNLTTGSGSDTVNVQGARADTTTTVNTGAGDDTINVSSDAPANTGTFADLAGSRLILDAGPGSNTLNASEAGSDQGDLVYLTSNQIASRGSNFLLTYLAAGGTYLGGVNLTTGSGNDTVGVLSALTGGVVTSVHTGPGDDSVSVNITPDSAYALFVDGGPGHDQLGVTDVAGGAVLHNHNFGPGFGTVEGDYLTGTPSYIDYQSVEGVATDPDADHSFVQSLYHNFLKRNGAKPEIQVWVGLLHATGSRSIVVDALKRSWEARTLLVKSWYADHLGRAAQGGEEQGWVGMLLQGHTEEEVLSSLLNTAEYFARAGNRDEAFLANVFGEILGRAPTAEETLLWLNSVRGLAGRGGEAWFVLDSVEHRANVTVDQYKHLLDRDRVPPATSRNRDRMIRPAPPVAEATAWVYSPLDLTSLAVAFASTQEFFDYGT